MKMPNFIERQSIKTLAKKQEQIFVETPNGTNIITPNDLLSAMKQKRLRVYEDGAALGLFINDQPKR